MFQRVAQLSELTDYIRDPQEVFPGLGFRGIQLQRMGGDEPDHGLPEHFSIATGSSKEPHEMMEIAQEILGSMTRFSKTRSEP